MANWIRSVCPACVRTVRVPDHRPILACSRCGAELVIQQTGEAVSLTPVIEALRELEVEASWPASLTSAYARAEILDLLSEIDQIWQERRHDLYVSLRLMVVATCGLFLAVVVEAGWLRARRIDRIGLPARAPRPVRLLHREIQGGQTPAPGTGPDRHLVDAGSSHQRRQP